MEALHILSFLHDQASALFSVSVIPSALSWLAE
jgi:hypothetical protein